MDCKIIVDSCCDMTQQLKKQLGLISIPLTIRLGQKEFTDDDSLDVGGFLAEMKASAEQVGTAAPPPFAYQEAIEEAQNSFVVTLSSQLSGSYANASLGKMFAEEENGETDAYVFDSKSASAGELLIAVKIRELLQAGLSKTHIIETVNQFIGSMKTYFVLERYDNLLKSGRLNKITEKILSLLNLRLLMGSDGNGNITLHAKTSGVKQTVDKMLSFIKNSGRKIAGENLVISHCNNLSLAEQLSAAIRQQFDFKEIFIVPMGGAITLYADDKGIVLAF